MQKIKQILIFLSIFILLTTPALSLAQQLNPAGPNGLVPCDNSASNPCGFPQLMALVNNIINFILYGMVIPIAAILFTYAGFDFWRQYRKKGISKESFHQCRDWAGDIYGLLANCSLNITNFRL